MNGIPSQMAPGAMDKQARELQLAEGGTPSASE